MKLKQLIKSCQKKERKAQREMVDFLAPYLMSVSVRYTRQREDAKDVVQESLILIFKNMDQFRSDSGAFRSWCARITINTAIAKYRKMNHQKEAYTLDIYPAPQYKPQAIERLLEEDILALINTLPPIPQQVFKLHCIDGFKHHEIAKLLDIEINHSRTILSRARKHLQTLFNETTKRQSNGCKAI